MIGAERHRGPDGEGLWSDPVAAIAMGHARLSIIDLSDAAAQPMATADGRYTIAFNGEIYNYRALRSELEAKGVRFRTTSDTEVLLELFVRQGTLPFNACTVFSPLRSGMRLSDRCFSPATISG